MTAKAGTPVVFSVFTPIPMLQGSYYADYLNANIITIVTIVLLHCVLLLGNNLKFYLGEVSSSRSGAVNHLRHTDLKH